MAFRFRGVVDDTPPSSSSSSSSSVLSGGSIDSALVGDYDWEKGGSSERYYQQLSLDADGSATYREDSETAREKVERSGSGRWSVDKDYVVWVVIDELKTETKIKKKPIPMIPGYEDGVKVDKKVSIDIPGDKLKSAPSSTGTMAPKNRWRRRF